MPPKQPNSRQATSAVQKIMFDLDAEMVSPYTPPAKVDFEEIRLSEFDSENDRQVIKNAVFTVDKIVHHLEDYKDTLFTQSAYESFRDKYHALIDELHGPSSFCSPKLREKIRLMLQGNIFDYIRQSTIISRALAKPFGYPGDYMLLQYLYNGEIVSANNIGKYYDAMYLDDDLSVAVVDRVNAMTNYLYDFIQNTSDNQDVHILNIASGSGFDVLNALDGVDKPNVTLHCFDQELYSLFYLRNKLSTINTSVKVEIYQKDIISFFKSWDRQVKFDLVYNIGLADYLPDLALKRLINNSLEALTEGGKFVLAHKDYEKFPYQYPEFSCNWVFFHRSFGDYERFLDANVGKDYKQFEHFYESEHKRIYFGVFTK